MILYKEVALHMNTLIAIITFCLGVGLKSFTSYYNDFI
nr:MAG TPA_asm: hypothetical protein [Bacteriophage sp.]